MLWVKQSENILPLRNLVLCICIYSKWISCFIQLSTTDDNNDPETLNENIDSAMITLDEPWTATNNIIPTHQTQLQLQNSPFISQ